MNNYVEALNEGETLLKSIPISTRLFHSLHKIILNNSRVANRNPGEYRKIQNFIGPSNSIKDATYIPLNVIRAMLKNIVFTLKDISKDVEISYNTLSKQIDLLVVGKFLYSDDKKRNTIYRCNNLLDILR